MTASLREQLDVRWPLTPEDVSAEARPAFEELQAAAEHMGLEGESEEHRWFFEGLRKGFAKKAKKDELVARRREEREEEVLSYGRLEAVALARCREELYAAEQRNALEEVMLASQAQMAAEVAELRMKQQMTEEMAQEALERCQASASSSPPLQSTQQLLTASLRARQQFADSLQEHALFKDVRLPLYTEDDLRSLAPGDLREHAFHVRATLGGLVADVPEERLDVILWILDAQREHLEILPDLEKEMASAAHDFEPAGFTNGSTASGSFDSSHQSVYSTLNKTNGKAASPHSPQADSRQTISLASPSPRGTSSPITPPKSTSRLGQHSPCFSVSSSPPAAARSSPASRSPATSTRTDATPCGSARKLADNDVRVLTPAVAQRLADKLGPVRLHGTPQMPKGG